MWHSQLLWNVLGWQQKRLPFYVLLFGSMDRSFKGWTFWVPTLHEREGVGEGSWHSLSSSCAPNTIVVFAPSTADNTHALFPFVSSSPWLSLPLSHTVTHWPFSEQTLVLDGAGVREQRDVAGRGSGVHYQLAQRPRKTDVLTGFNVRSSVPFPKAFLCSG